MSDTSRRSGGGGERRDRKDRGPREEKSNLLERVVAIDRVSRWSRAVDASASPHL